MYIPKINLTTDQTEIIAFMKQYSFATLISAKDNYPTATHLPFIISEKEGKIVLNSHFAKANTHWKMLEKQQLLVIFNEPHAYISPKHYDKIQSVPTWNYVSVHAYGRGKLITDPEPALKLLESMIGEYERAYQQQWDGLSMDYKLKMLKGIVAFEVELTDIQGKKKLSQNKSKQEQERVIDTLASSQYDSEVQIANFMRENLIKIS